MCVCKNVQSWISKYRPMKLIDTYIDKKLEEKFFLIIKINSIPNLIIFGPPGCGKTTIGKFKLFLIFHSLMNLEINASHTRGVDIVRIKIKSFCQTKTNLKNNLKKLIIIDEAESLTDTAQEALRRTVENFSQIARFILICNYPSKIIEAIQSRCAILRFKKIKEWLILRNIIKIFYWENILFSIAGLELLIFLAEGDIRRILNESEKIFKSFLVITNKTVNISCFFPEVFMLGEFLQNSFNQNYISAYEIFVDICNYGLDPIEIFQGIFRILKKMQSSSSKKIKILKMLCEFQIGFFQNKFKIDFIISVLKKIKQF
nr:DNA replication factor C complex subunit Rfc2 [Cryptomonas sp.]